MASLPIIGVGGVMNPFDALAKFEAGATLVQVYTGLVYAGPEFGEADQSGVVAPEQFGIIWLEKCIQVCKKV